MIVVDLLMSLITDNAKEERKTINTTSPSTFFSGTVISMLFKSTNIAVVLAAFLPGSFAFVPSNRPYHATARKSSLSMSSALIVQNKGGGHGELGYQLAKNLLNNEKITSITILQDESCNYEKEPFKSYFEDLEKNGVHIIQANFAYEEMTTADMQGILGGRDVTFDYIWDNASKGPDATARCLVNCAKNWGPKLYSYVSSAGMYKPTGEFPMPETTPLKESAGQNLFEQFAVDAGLPFVTFRPQYIYGPKANKYDYIDWYFDRLVRELPLPIPSDGTQKVSLTNSEDVASLLASVLNNEEAAIEQRYFNCGTDQLVSYDEVAHLCAKAAGIDADKVMIEHYDHEKLGKGKFPFRMTDFYVAPDMAKEKLGWAGPSHSLGEDLTWYYDGYKSRGGPSKEMDLMKDYEIVVGHKTTYDVGSIYDKYDPLIIDTSNVKPLNVEE